MMIAPRYCSVRLFICSLFTFYAALTRAESLHFCIIHAAYLDERPRKTGYIYTAYLTNDSDSPLVHNRVYIVVFEFTHHII
jgi:hypothetical protein